MFAAVREAQTAALGALRAGVSAAAVHRRAADTFKRLGYETRTEGTVREGFIHSTGHGVGLSIHESPVLGLGQGRLRSGNVVTVEPGLYYRDTGAVRIEDTVVVTAKGWSYLVPCEKRLEL
jgi:Xaa-Pro aminopeptidase